MEHIQHLIDCEESYIDDIIEANFVQLFISLQDDGNIDLEVHRNALEFLSNILKFGNFDHALILFEDHFIISIRDLLNHDDSGVKEMTLHCIKNLLEKLSSDYANDARQEIINCGLLVKIKQLQMSPKLCKAANEVMAVFLHAN
uniref:Uncharacterized protein n=1 Tax=Panagrolaimus superbus TaxID=310955 RepID=A0A914Y505_9BILA